MSRIICPYADEDMCCIVESRGDTDIDCSKCIIQKEASHIAREKLKNIKLNIGKK